MPKFFTDKNGISGECAVLTGEKAAHITKSLRMTVGERITLCDGEGTDYGCVIKSVGAEVTLAVESSEPSAGEPPYRVTVFQGLSKGERFDTVVQKSVECGAYAIVPVQTERATVRLSSGDCDKKNVRWQRIAESAAEQCGRGIIPKMEPLMTFGEALDAATAFDLALFCYENEDGATLKTVLESSAAAECADVPRIAVIIGPEGGFSEREADAARAAAEKCKRLHSVSLGPRILRTESAAPFVLACISMALEL